MIRYGMNEGQIFEKKSERSNSVEWWAKEATRQRNKSILSGRSGRRNWNDRGTTSGWLKEQLGNLEVDYYLLYKDVQ